MGQSPDLRVGSVSLGGAQQQKHLERAAGLRRVWQLNQSSTGPSFRLGAGSAVSRPAYPATPRCPRAKVPS